MKNDLRNDVSALVGSNCNGEQVSQSPIVTSPKVCDRVHKPTESAKGPPSDVPPKRPAKPAHIDMEMLVEPVEEQDLEQSTWTYLCVSLNKVWALFKSSFGACPSLWTAAAKRLFIVFGNILFSLRSSDLEGTHVPFGHGPANQRQAIMAKYRPTTLDLLELATAMVVVCCTEHRLSPWRIFHLYCIIRLEKSGAKRLHEWRMIAPSVWTFGR